jgi:hypothetical protein
VIKNRLLGHFIDITGLDRSLFRDFSIKPGKV